jgi:hypothetical protein
LSRVCEKSVFGLYWYAYALNNPLIYTDPSGEFIFTALALIIPGGQAFLPWAIGADIGMWSGGSAANGTMNPFKWDYSSGKTWGYMAGGALVGGLSGGYASSIATSGMPFANTAAIMGGSFMNSVGMNIVTGGQTPVSMSFGIASYNFTSGEWGYLGKKGNKWYENVGYGLGAIANFSDISRGFRNDAVQLQTENTPSMYESGKDKIGHSQLLDVDGNSLVDFGPGGDFFKFDKGVNNWIEHASGERLSQTIDIPGNIYSSPQMTNGINLNAIQRFSSRLNNNSGFYNFALRSCSTQAARALTLGGVPVFGLHPYLLRFQISTGLRPYMFNYTYTNGY